LHGQVQGQFHQAQRLPDTVVQVGRDALALFLLDGQQLAG
jgi:hypothetical protein